MTFVEGAQLATAITAGLAALVGTTALLISL